MWVQSLASAYFNSGLCGGCAPHNSFSVSYTY
jgi:hypothetical protein